MEDEKISVLYPMKILVYQPSMDKIYYDNSKLQVQNSSAPVEPNILEY